MSITTAIINTYGKEQLRACFLNARNEKQARALFIALLKRDAPNVLKSFKWGGLKNSLNGLLERLEISYNN